MPDAPSNVLLTTTLAQLLERLEAAGEAEREAIWREADGALEAMEADEDAEVALPVWDRDLEAVRALVAAWAADARPLPAWDKAVTKRAFKAYKKRLKLARLDEESTTGGSPLSAGRASSIIGVRPPDGYGPDVWAVLIRQGKLRDAGGGLLELATV